MNKIRIGVIGCGKIAQVRHLPEYATNPNVELVGYYDRIPDRAEETAARYGGTVYESYFALLNDPGIDAVSVCVENRAHAEITTAALYAGKHVLCEKPMAVTLGECESMVAAAERNGRYLMIGHNMRFDPVYRQAKQLLDEGVIGDVITFRAVIGNAGPEGWAMGSRDEDTWYFDKTKAAMGALSDLGIHKVDLLQFLLGQKVVETTSKVVTLNKRGDDGKLISVDDNALCILRMSGGAMGTMAASWTIYGHHSTSTCFYGTRGSLLLYSDETFPIIVRDHEGRSSNYPSLKPTGRSGVIDEFVDALVHDREPEVSGAEALTTMRTIFACVESSDKDTSVKVNRSYVSHL
ncbi:MAG: Gfo/Idh/MocA family oxidoreductase [Oscillospiraceae bacterium]|nr:Gfo/Idh/MocA family oxidoreductase [Oscillospiraceae bacterium]